jgi:hypothetical protein
MRRRINELRGRHGMEDARRTIGTRNVCADRGVLAATAGAQPDPTVDAVGESHYQEALETVAGGRTSFGVHIPLITAQLVREPTNPYDPDAVRVEADGRQLGYLPKEDAPRFHAAIDKLAVQGCLATCRARLTGGWDRGHGDRGSIGLQLLTGRRPAIWNGRVAFLPATPFHEHHQVQLLPGLPTEVCPKDKAVVTLVDAGSGALALRHGGTWLGHITDRPNLVAYVDRVVAAGLPPTARDRVQESRLVVPLADQDATIGRLPLLVGGDLPAVRRRLIQRAGGLASGAGGCGTTPPPGSRLARPGRRRGAARLPELLLLLVHASLLGRGHLAPRFCSPSGGTQLTTTGPSA